MSDSGNRPRERVVLDSFIATTEDEAEQSHGSYGEKMRAARRGALNWDQKMHIDEEVAERTNLNPLESKLRPMMVGVGTGFLLVAGAALVVISPLSDSIRAGVQFVNPLVYVIVAIASVLVALMLAPKGEGTTKAKAGYSLVAVVITLLLTIFLSSVFGSVS